MTLTDIFHVHVQFQRFFCLLCHKASKVNNKRFDPASIVFASFITACYYNQIKHVTSFDINWKYFKANIFHRYLENAITMQISEFLLQVLKFLFN